MMRSCQALPEDAACAASRGRHWWHCNGSQSKPTGGKSIAIIIVWYFHETISNPFKPNLGLFHLHPSYLIPDSVLVKLQAMNHGFLHCRAVHLLEISCKNKKLHKCSWYAAAPAVSLVPFAKSNHMDLASFWSLPKADVSVGVHPKLQFHTNVAVVGVDVSGSCLCLQWSGKENHPTSWKDTWWS